MSTPDPEWNDLVDAWQSEPAGAAAPAALSEEDRRRIRSRVKWHSFRLTLIAAGEVILAVGYTAWLGFGVLDPGRLIDLVALIGTAVLFAIAFTFSVWNRLGIWWPASESTRDFVGLSIERSRRKLRTLRFCRWLLALEIAFLVPWLSWALLSRQPPATPAKWAEVFGALLLLSGAILAWSAWYRKRTLRELAEWEALMRSLDEEPFQAQAR